MKSVEKPSGGDGAVGLDMLLCFRSQFPQFGSSVLLRAYLLKTRLPAEEPFSANICGDIGGE